jgi:hypothetical protein
MARLDELKQRLRLVEQEARSGARGTRLNIAGRRNVQIATNVGRDGAEERASWPSRRHPIEQHGSTDQPP